MVILGDVEPDFLSSSQMNHLVEFVTEKGGGVLFVAGENNDPLRYKGTPLERPPADRAGPGPQPDRRGGRDHRVPPQVDAGRVETNPIFRFGDDEAGQPGDLGKRLPELNGISRPPEETGGPGPGRAPDPIQAPTARSR